MTKVKIKMIVGILMLTLAVSTWFHPLNQVRTASKMPTSFTQELLQFADERNEPLNARISRLYNI